MPKKKAAMRSAARLLRGGNRLQKCAQAAEVIQKSATRKKHAHAALHCLHARAWQGFGIVRNNCGAEFIHSVFQI